MKNSVHAFDQCLTHSSFAIFRHSEASIVRSRHEWPLVWVRRMVWSINKTSNFLQSGPTFESLMELLQWRKRARAARCAPTTAWVCTKNQWLRLCHDWMTQKSVCTGKSLTQHSHSYIASRFYAIFADSSQLMYNNEDSTQGTSTVTIAITFSHQGCRSTIRGVIPLFHYLHFQNL